MDGRNFWAGADSDCVFHLHGGVHLGFNHDHDRRLGDLSWYDDREEARVNAGYVGSGERRQDGTEVARSAIITGLDKLSRLQTAPFSYFYCSLRRDALRADVIYVIGYGFGDLHLNSWLREARAQSYRPPIVIVDYWRDGFARSSAFNEGDRKLIDIWHDLRTDVGYQPGRDTHSGGWTVDAAAGCAIWDRGFGPFLDQLEGHDEVLARLRIVS